jgi:hypothetical protein
MVLDRLLCVLVMILFILLLVLLHCTCVAQDGQQMATLPCAWSPTETKGEVPGTLVVPRQPTNVQHGFRVLGLRV